MKLTIGQPAPHFSLYNSQKQLVSLADYRGKKLLLLFFPLAFSSVCTKELCNVRDGMSEFQSLDTNIMGISVDSLYTLAKFREAEHFDFPLLSDFNHEVSEIYGCLHETFSYGMKYVSKRSAFVIDETGKIAYAEVLENPGELPNFEAIKKVLAGISATKTPV